MKTRFRITLILFLICLLALPGLAGAAAADDRSAPLTAPLNPAFLAYQAELAGGSLSTASASGHGFGHIPEPLAPVATTGTSAIDTASFPASYDLRQSGRLTAIRDQGQLGNCWTFASLGALESYLKPTTTTDLSENNLRWNNGFDFGLDGGGNATMAIAYLARWSGPVSESNDPYGSGQKSGLAPLYHIQRAEYLPQTAEAIKAALMSSGGVYSSLNADAFDDSRYYNQATAALYYTGYAAINHDIVIVGWDDNYDRSNFSSTPPGNGAWLIRNSWGTDWGQDGYFYLSYYDRYAGANPTVFNNAEATSNYSRSYQYDPLGKSSARGYDNGDQTSWGANIFTAVASEPLTAISTYALSPNTSAEIYIYTDVAAGDPNNGQLRSSQTASFTNQGYYTVALNNPVSLSAGQRFAVVIKYRTPQSNYPVPLEAPQYGYSSGARANSGESFISADGSGNWYDTGYNDNANVCIKAFTGGGTSVATLTGIRITSPATKLTYQIGEALDLSGLVVSGTYSDGSSRTETVTAANVSGFNSATAGTKTLIISIGGKTTSYTITVKNATSSGVDVYYRTHIQNIGWQYDCKNGQVSGTSGYGYRLEAIQIQLVQSNYDLGVAYRTHIQNIGWAPWHYDKEISGTSGLGYRLEAIEIQLVGADADRFDVYYRVHCQNFGWMGWAKNGEMAGTSGYGYRLEAIQIEVVPKGTYFSVDAAEQPASLVQP